MSDEINEGMVNRCECINKTFAQLKNLGSLEAAIAAGAGQECEGCVPWLKLSFASGEDEIALEDPRLKDYE
ncbi:MAG: hypothetical protein AUK35_08300 [Zetaproteobacteria bacterium CG2_30_46_52]|nr:MAG: hypothetical protein AUK35_08300 [Zetaproteobacteria bacterium CG2_30_46_52]